MVVIRELPSFAPSTKHLSKGSQRVLASYSCLVNEARQSSNDLSDVLSLALRARKTFAVKTRRSRKIFVRARAPKAQSAACDAWIRCMHMQSIHEGNVSMIEQYAKAMDHKIKNLEASNNNLERVINSASVGILEINSGDLKEHLKPSCLAFRAIASIAAQVDELRSEVEDGLQQVA